MYNICACIYKDKFNHKMYKIKIYFPNVITIIDIIYIVLPLQNLQMISLLIIILVYTAILNKEKKSVS